MSIACTGTTLIVTDVFVGRPRISGAMKSELAEVGALTTEQVLRARSLVLTEKAFAALNEA